MDTGLVCHLTGLRMAEALENGHLKGPILENFVVADLHNKIKHTGRDVEMFFYRDNAHRELDLILHDRDSDEVLFVEIKSVFTPKAEWAHALATVADIAAPAFDVRRTRIRRAILYRGESRSNWPRPGIDFINWKDFLLGF